MYRIITSTTKEEHFESPNAAAFGMMTYCGNASPNSTVSSNSVSSLKITPRLSTAQESAGYFGEYDVYGDLYIHGNIYAKNLNANSSITVNELATDPTGNTWMGETGELAFTANYAYLCVNTNSWIRWKIDSNW